MTSFFKTALAVNGSMQDALYGEQFLIEPRTRPADASGRPDPNARSIADPSRPPRTITGVWTDPHEVVSPKNRTGHPAAEAARFGDGKAVVDFETIALPYAVLIGDRVTRVASGALYTVADPSDDGFTRSAVALTAFAGRS